MYSVDISKPISCSRAGKMRQHDGWEHNGRRWQRDNIFVFVIGGQVTFFIGDEVYNAERGTVVVIPRDTFYRAHTADMCEYYFFHFSGEVQGCGEARFDIQRAEPFSFKLSDISYDKIYFENGVNVRDSYNDVYMSILACFEYNSMGSSYGRYMLDNQFFQILLFLHGLAENSSGTDKYPLTVGKMISYVKKNVTKPLSVAAVCEEHKISASYAARIFKKHVGITLNEYINKEKLYFARELIDHSSMNLTEIADYLSFCDVFYFSRLFKRMFGMSPSEYKRRK